MLESVATTRPPIFVTPISTDIATARDWFSRFEGAGLDGVVAKRADLPYRPGERVMVKVKHRRTADCVVAGYRIHKDGNGVGSLLLGLYDDSGDLQHVGVASSFTAKRRRELLDELRPLLDGALDGHPWQGWAEAVEREQAEGRRMPGAVSRWNAKKDLSWTAIRAERVAEVQFDQLQGRRFRHATSFVRWRPDREPSSCTYDQLEVAAPLELESVFGGSGS
jgi:ATP-dependent DNA ligase